MIASAADPVAARLLSEGRPTKRHRHTVRAEAVDLGLRLVKP